VQRVFLHDGDPVKLVCDRCFPRRGETTIPQQVKISIQNTYTLLYKSHFTAKISRQNRKHKITPPLSFARLC
ncbi:hypothetical protein, partial [Enterobacter sp.]|uniref:hypothetical protein n=1 Tax=Enterobacter sp. TaxID=42895 RepID=UPI0033411AC8